MLRLRVPNTGSMVELSSKFGCDPGEAVDLILEAFRIGLVVEGLSFHVGSQCTNFDNFVQALNIAAAVMREAEARGHEIKILDIGGGFPVPYDTHVKPFSALAKKINAEIDRLFRQRHRDPGRAGAVPGGHGGDLGGAHHRQSRARRQDLLLHRRQRLSHLFGHHLRPLPVPIKAFKKGKTEICAVFGQTCDGLDTISQSEELPELEIEDLVYSENIGAYSNASATWFNGFPPAKVVHVNE